MESSSKRRKVEHSTGLRHNGLIDFESRDATRISTASTFVLQADELLREARLDPGKALPDVDSQLHRLKGIIDSISPHDPLTISEATSDFEKQHRIIIPYPDPRPAKDAPYKIWYDKPSQCNVVGSYVSRTMVKTQPEVSVDMVVQMPRTLFQDKDYMNMRYFYRRAYYIAYIAGHVRKQVEEAVQLSFEDLHENPLLPVLVMRWPSKVAIKLIPCAPDDLFPWSKTTATSKTLKGETGDWKVTTPFYNSTLNAERAYIPYLRLLTHTAKECPAFADACILGRIWLQQRGFGGSVSRGGMGHFEWAVLVALLLQQQSGRNGQAALSTSLSSTELFKATVRFLSVTDVSKKPLVLGSSAVDTEAIREAGPVVFDPVRQLNILAKMSPWSARMLQMYAKSTTDLLADELVDKLDPTFIIKADVPLYVLDVVFTIAGCDAGQAAEVHRLLRRAYGNRAQLVDVQLPARPAWALTKRRPTSSGTPAGTPAGELRVGVIFDPVQMARQMEHGPAAEEQKEAAKFRQLWQEKSELRRFKDGSILECVEWTSRLPQQICEEMTRFVLSRHLRIAEERVSAMGRDLSQVFGFSHLDKPAFDAARRALQTLERDIRALDEMPLHVRQISPISACARYSSLRPPTSYDDGTPQQPTEVNLYLEASSRWPENLVAIQAAKTEFLLDIDRRLTKAHPELHTSLGRETPALGEVNPAYLDIIYPTAAFRLRIHCDLERTLLERRAGDKTLDARTREDAGSRLASFDCSHTALPLHTQTMATWCTRLPALSPALRLVKHWFARHLLTPHVREELVELFTLHAFLQPYPWPQPSSPTSALLRTLLLLSRWDWRQDPLLVAVDDAPAQPSSSVVKLRHELRSWRSRDPNMNRTVLLVATPHDPSGRAFTGFGPSKLVASRMTALAKAACRLVRDHGLRLDPTTLFDTSLADYDVLFHLCPKALRAVSAHAPSSRFRNLDANLRITGLPRAHPVDVLAQELARAYDDTLIFFRGGVDDHVIAAVWNPALQRHKFRPGLAYNCRAEDDDHVDVNRDAVLLEIARVGGDLIKRIEVVE